MQRVQATYHICAWITVQRFLVEANARQMFILLLGRYELLPYMQALRQLSVLIPIGVCSLHRTVPDEEMPPLLPLLAQLPAHMQMALEQAIEAERRGHATHTSTWWDFPAWLQNFQSRHRAAWGPPSDPSHWQV